MTANDIYTVAGSSSGSSGDSGDGGTSTAALLDAPQAAMGSGGNLYIADSGDEQVQEVAAATHTQWGISMTANDIYTIAGSTQARPETQATAERRHRRCCMGRRACL